MDGFNQHMMLVNERGERVPIAKKTIDFRLPLLGHVAAFLMRFPCSALAFRHVAMGIIMLRETFIMGNGRARPP